MSRQCPDCGGRVRVGWLMPEGGPGHRFVPSGRSPTMPSTRELAIRKTKRCAACGLEPVGLDALGRDAAGERPEYD